MSRKLAAGGTFAAPGRGASCRRRRGRSDAAEAAMTAHHGANSPEQERAADHAGRRRGRGAEKRAALSDRSGSRLSRHRLRSGAPSRRHFGSCLARSHRGHRAPRLAPAEQAVAHAAEKTGFTRDRLRPAFELADAGVRPLERFVLHQHRLHQCVRGIGRLPQSVLDHTFGLRIALGVFQRSEAIEQFGDEIAFLWGHRSSPSSRAYGNHVGDAGGDGMIVDEKNFCLSAATVPAPL